MVDTLVYAINEARQTGIKTVLVSIIATQGSTPRKAGASMLVYPDGRVLGTIGGGRRGRGQAAGADGLG